MAIYPNAGPMGSTAGYTTSPAQSGPNYAWLNEIGLGISGAGLGMSVAGAYYGLKARQDELRTEALNAEFAANQANIAARANERLAEDIIRAGQQEAGRRGQQAAADVAAFRASTAAGGVEVGTGTAGEIERSIRIAAEVDKRTLRTNAQMRAAAAREQGASMRAGSLIGRATAANLRGSASSINPAMGAVGAGLNGSGSLIGQYLQYRGRR